MVYFFLRSVLEPLTLSTNLFLSATEMIYTTSPFFWVWK